MADEVTRFPISKWQQIKNRRGKRIVNCGISGRYLKYHEGHGTTVEGGICVQVDVMTDGNDSETPDRKICELYLHLGELKAMIQTLEDEITDRKM